MIFFDQDSAYVFPGFPSNIDQIVPSFIKRMKGVLRRVRRWMA